MTIERIDLPEFLNFHCTEVFRTGGAVRFNLHIEIEEKRWWQAGSLTVFVIGPDNFHFFVVLQSSLFKKLNSDLILEETDRVFAMIKPPGDATYSFEAISENDGIEFRCEGPRILKDRNRKDSNHSI